MLKTILGTVAGILVALSALTPAAGQSAEPGDIVTTVGELLNDRQVDEALDYYTNDAVMVIGPCLQAFGPDGCVGKEQIGTILHAVDEAGAQLTVLQQSESGSTVTQRREVRSNAISGTGVERIIEDVTFEVVDGQIVSQIAVPDRNDSQTAQFLAAQAMRPPATGDAGLAAAEEGGPVGTWSWAIVASSLFAAGLWLWRRWNNAHG
jgi:ketosteroid isomerase-like protein